MPNNSKLRTSQECAFSVRLTVVTHKPELFISKLLESIEGIGSLTGFDINSLKPMQSTKLINRSFAFIINSDKEMKSNSSEDLDLMEQTLDGRIQDEEFELLNDTDEGELEDK